MADVRKGLETKAYRLYVAECLRMISENTAKNVGGRYVAKSLSEFWEPSRAEPSDERTGEEIAAEICRKNGLKVVKQHESI